MKHVTMIAYSFPPEGNAGAYRPLRFVRHLRPHGYTASVVSAVGHGYERYDPELARAIPPDVDVTRVAVRDWWQALQARRTQRQEPPASAAASRGAAAAGEQGGRLRRVAREGVRRLEAWCYHPDMCMRWIPPATAATIDVVTRRRSDVIWATAGPVSSFVVAWRAAKRTGVPYVLDFRDAWTITYNAFEARRPAWAVRADRRALFRYLQDARAVTFRYTAEAECYARVYPGAFDPAAVHIIPNGFDGPIDEPDMPRGDRCTVLYAGTLSSYRYDTLLDALRRLKRSEPGRARRLRLVVVGEGSELLAADAARLDLTDIVETAGPTSHAEAARLQRDAHALLVLGRPPEMKGYELFAGAKLFGYLKAARPIVGVVPADETRRILERVGVSTLADAGSIEEIVAVFDRLLEAWSDGTLLSLVPSRAACQAFSAERQTAALIRALEGLPALDPFVPDSVELPRSLRDDLLNRVFSPAAAAEVRRRDALLHS